MDANLAPVIERQSNGQAMRLFYVLHRLHVLRESQVLCRSFAFVNREHAAELTAKHPERLLGFACFVPYDNGKILQESECAIKQYNLMRNSPLQSELASR